MAEQLLDIKALEDIYGADTVKELLEMSLEEAGQLIGQIAEGISKQDARAVAQDAHQLKGMCLTMTMNEMSELSRQIESTAKEGVLAGTGELLSKLQSKYGQFVDYMNAFSQGNGKQ